MLKDVTYLVKVADKVSAAFTNTFIHMDKYQDNPRITGDK